MLDWLFPPDAERRLLPGGTFKGPTPFIVAIMTFVMLLIGAAGLSLSNAAALVSRGIETRYALQVPGGDAQAAQVLQAVRKVPGVRSAEPVSEAEMRQTLERWLGPAAARSRDLPVPALITIDLAAASDAATVRAATARVAPDASLSAYDQQLSPLLGVLTALQGIALALVLLVAGATAAAVVLAARGALDTHRSTIDVMHGIGATDVQITHLFQRKIALDAAAGALAGAAAAAIVLVLLGGGASALAGDLAGRPPLGPRDAILLGLLPLLLVVLATGVARAAVLAALRRAL